VHRGRNDVACARVQYACIVYQCLSHLPGSRLRVDRPVMNDDSRFYLRNHAAQSPPLDTSTMAGSMPMSRSRCFAEVRVVPTTVHPSAIGNGATRRPIAPVAPARIVPCRDLSCSRMDKPGQLTPAPASAFTGQASRCSVLSKPFATTSYFLSQMTGFLSLVSATKIASNFAGSVLLTFWLTM
jgi:hypothetical protein